MPHRFKRLIEPFSGVAAVSVATAAAGYTEKFCINDLNAPLISLLKEAVEEPRRLLEAYKAVWDEQFSYAEGHVQHFYAVRDRFNLGDTSPANVLYLLARCVKGSVRYSKRGDFNQSPDKRRHGSSPLVVASNVLAMSRLLAGKATFSSLDYREVLSQAQPDDLVYMDPPYQGVCEARDNRYVAGISYDDFSAAIETLDRRGVAYLISYDGTCGNKTYGRELPASLRCRKVMLNAGLSSQATLLGRISTTYEALYVSDTLFDKVKPDLEQQTFLETLG